MPWRLKEMASEKEWVRDCLRPRLLDALQVCNEGEWSIAVESGKRLTYAHEILCYGADGHDRRRNSKYETDLLISDTKADGDWIPRIVLECKKGSVTTHDALTYSTKAATHKHVHPYLRYGILIGAYGSDIPGRLIRHGAYFDFMMVWSREEPTEKEWSAMVTVLTAEVAASRTMEKIFTDNRLRSRKKFGLFHRQLRLQDTGE